MLGNSQANETGILSRREDLAMVGLLVALGAVAAGARFNDQLIGLTGDNAEYLILARGFLTGQPYSNAEYPWGYPALLTPFLWVAGQGGILAAIPWMKLLTILLFLVSLPLMYTLFRMRHGMALSFVATMLFAVNSTVLLYANDVMTEIPYTCASFGALLFWQLKVAPWLADKVDASVPWRGLLVAGCLMGVAYYLRAVGVALLAAPVLVLFWHKRVRAGVLLALFLGAIALPWLLYSNSLGEPNYASKLLLRDPYNPALGRVESTGEFARRLVDIGNVYLTYVVPHMVLPDPTPKELQGAIGPVLAALLVGGLGLRLARRVELPEVYAILFMVILFAWPWRADRFLLPVYPLCVHYILESIAWLVRQASNAWRVDWTAPRRLWALRTAVAALVLIIVLPSLWLAGNAGAENLGYLSGDEQPTGHTPDWVQFFAACEWLKEHTPPGSVVLSRKSTLVTVYSDRPALLIPLIPPERYPQFLRENNVSYVLDDAFPWSVHTQKFLEPAISKYPGMFKLVDTTGPPVTRVWEVVKGK